jgi:hypothetical protein
MLNTDLSGVIENIKINKTLHLLIIISILVVLYIVVSRYMERQQSDFINTMIIHGNLQGCKGDIPKVDEAIIRSMIELPNRDPAKMTSSMVVPAPTTNDEDRRRTRMDILNMFYNSFDDDSVTIGSRPKGLYVIP